MITIQTKGAIKQKLDKSKLVTAAQVAMETAGQSKASGISIVLGNDDLLRKLNYQFRGEDSPTDVLSFPSGEVDPDTSDLYLGDVIISIPMAKRQANAENHPVEQELQLLVVHGVLHLLGHDHVNADDKKQMQALQDQIVGMLALNIEITL